MFNCEKNRKPAEQMGFSYDLLADHSRRIPFDPYGLSYIRAAASPCCAGGLSCVTSVYLRCAVFTEVLQKAKNVVLCSFKAFIVIRNLNGYLFHYACPPIVRASVFSDGSLNHFDHCSSLQYPASAKEKSRRRSAGHPDTSICVPYAPS